MSRIRVVVLTAHSMLAEGIAARLRQHLDRIDLRVIDCLDSDCLVKIREAQPSVIVLEADNENIDRFCPLDEILAAAAQVKVLCINPIQSKVQVITSEQRKVSGATDLISMVLPPV